jgi:uncharacterized protein (DUF849 family)
VLKMVAECETILDGANIMSPRLLHGVDATAWPLLDEAIARGYEGRIGFEDTFALPDGTRGATNADLVRAAKRRAKSRTAGVQGGPDEPT